MHDYRIENWLLNMVKPVYDKSKGCMRINRMFKKCINTKQKVRQGYLISFKIHLGINVYGMFEGMLKLCVVGECTYTFVCR